MRINFNGSFEETISIDNLLLAWLEFIKGKRNKPDVLIFQQNLIDNIISLHNDLTNHLYKHRDYETFDICDPKPRTIHKASVRDRLLHRAIYRKLYPFFDKTFSNRSFSSRKNKGIHRALNCFTLFTKKVSKNNTKTCWILKCDIKKFFASIDHKILTEILVRYVPNTDILWLLKEIIYSFNAKSNIGLPLGNLTSQLFSNIYLNELDLFVEHNLKIGYYIRYADDFAILSNDKNSLNIVLQKITELLEKELKLSLNQDKIFIKTYASGVDFLGWIHFPHHRVLRTVTKKRITKKLENKRKPQTIASYKGLLKHGNTYKLRKNLNLLD